jgi:hypothetical protein
MLLYHWLTAAIFRKNNVTWEHHLDEVILAGEIVAKNYLEYEYRTLKHKDDGPEADEHVFLTTRRDLMREGERLAKAHAKDKAQLKKLNWQEYAFVFPPAVLRNRPGVLHRERDVMSAVEEDTVTFPFTDQELDEDCEILVPKRLPLILATGIIVSGKAKRFNYESCYYRHRRPKGRRRQDEQGALREDVLRGEESDNPLG